MPKTDYMTVGEAAKKMGVSVRTLQYYDKLGLLAPSAQSEGGRRLYAQKDLVRLHQILSLKSLGFSLEDIKERLPALDTPAEVADALSAQAEDLRSRISQLSDCLAAVEGLRAEVLQMQAVDFKKYADIIVNLQMKNEYYFLIKHFDEETLDHIRTRFDAESGKAFIERFMYLCDRALEMQKEGVPPESEVCQQLAKTFWEMVVEFTGGDMRLLPRLMAIGEAKGDDGWHKKQEQINAYLGPALEIMFERQGTNPFSGE